MTPLESNSRCAGKRRRRPTGLCLLLLLLLAALVALPGCSGCRKTPQQRQAEKAKKEAERREKERKKQEKKPDLEWGRLRCLPHDLDTDFAYYKPGHWVETALPARPTTSTSPPTCG